MNNKIEKALRITKEKFEPIMRNNGRNYYEDHILKVYGKVKELGYGEDYQLVALLHDMREDTDWSKEKLAEEFDQQTADAVELLTIVKTNDYNDEARQVARCLQNPLSKVVRFCDRKSNLEQTSVKENSIAFVKRLRQKTIDHYLPIFDGEFYNQLKYEVDRLERELKESGNWQE